MRTFFTETFFAGITIICDVKIGGIEMTVGNYYFTLWQGILNEGFEVEGFVKYKTIICANMQIISVIKVVVTDAYHRVMLHTV